ncbi:MAG: SDR family oxidoreductase [Nitrososphaerales archaeon]
MATEILVTGSSSLVGSHFVEKFGKRYNISAIGRNNIFEGTDALTSFKKVDLQDEKKLREAVRASNAKVVINYAAETNVDGCEVERNRTDGKVYLTNTSAVRYLSEVCKETGKILYQISTDAVFDGTQGPYSEADLTGPISKEISWYGYTKYLAEKQIIETSSEYCIIRISHPYRAHFKLKTDFARNMLNLYRDEKLFPLFTDQIFTPSFVDDISNSLDFLIQRNARGIYHVASRSPTTPFDFAHRLLSVFFPDRDLNALKTESIMNFVQRRAPRPVKGGLRTDKIANEGFIPRTVEDAIMDFHRQSMQDS